MMPHWLNLFFPMFEEPVERPKPNVISLEKRRIKRKSVVQKGEAAYRIGLRLFDYPDDLDDISVSFWKVGWNRAYNENRKRIKNQSSNYYRLGWNAFLYKIPYSNCYLHQPKQKEDWERGWREHFLAFRQEKEGRPDGV